MRQLLFHTRETPSLENVRFIRNAMEVALENTVSSESTRQKIRLLLSETLTNLVQHADPSPGSIEVRFGTSSHQWQLEIIDDGEPWNPLEHSTEEGFESFELEEHGRGIALLKTQSDHLSYQSGKQGNCLRMTWDFPRERKKPCVLIVDDDETQCRLLKAYLSDRFEILTATSGSEALEQLKNEQIRLVLSDIQMPGMNGLALRDELDRYRDKRLIPFIFITGLTDEGSMRQASEMGVDDFLSKPVNKATLIHVIRRVLQRSEQVRGALSNRLDQEITGALGCNLPHQHPHWKFAAFCLNTGKGGGDFLLHRDTGKQLLLVLSDTMGHDDHAKFFSHAYAGYLRGFMSSVSGLAGPEDLLRRLSGVAWQDEIFSRVSMTCAALTLFPQGKVKIASAAHPPALLISASGLQEIQTAGVLPGLLPDSTYASKQLSLQDGERLAIYTDGLFESAQNAQGRAQLEAEIRDSLFATRQLSIEEALTATQSLFTEIAGPRPSDDATLILMEPSGQ